MKKRSRIYRILTVFVLLIASRSMANAQHYGEGTHIDTAYNRVIKVYPLQLGEVRIAHEKMRATHVSHELSLSYIYSAFLKGDEATPENQHVQGAAIQMSQRKYSLKNEGRPFGFFHGPVFGYRFLAYEQNVFQRLAKAPEDDPAYEAVGRLYQNALDLSYQLGVQFKLTNHLTADVAAAVGGRVKYVAADNADKLLTDHIIGHAVIAEKNSAIFVTPLPQLNLSVGYAF